jgi:hypothetical protein
MGFTDRMGDVMAAADTLVHSSAGLTVLEAVIRGCPVVSYGFNYGHVRCSNAAMERFKLAQVARHAEELRPAIERALELHPEPDTRFAKRPPTASLILSDDRRAPQIPAWRLRTARAITGTAAVLVIAGWTLTTGLSYTIVSHIAHIRPVTTVKTDRPAVGVLIDAPGAAIPAVASTLSAYGIHASFALAQPSALLATSVTAYHDEALPRLPGGGLWRWLGASGQLRRLLKATGYQHGHFLYTSSGPSLGQWLEAHGAGGRLVAGAVKLEDSDDSIGLLHPGEVVEFSVTSRTNLTVLIDKLLVALRLEHLVAVPVGSLMAHADTSAD